MRIITTGLSSFMGRELLPLIDSDDVIYNLCRDKKKDKNSRIINIHFDELESDKAKLIEGADAFLHLASASRLNEKKLESIKEIVEFNIGTSSYLTKKVVELGCKKIINISTNWAYLSSDLNQRQFFNLYSLSKASFDLYLKDLCFKIKSLSVVNLILYDNFSINDSRGKIFNLIYNSLVNREQIKFSPGRQIINLTRMFELSKALKYVIYDMDFNKGYSMFQITGVESDLIGLAELVSKEIGEKQTILFGKKDYRDGEIMAPKYHFDEIPYIGNRKIELYQSIKNELNNLEY